MTRRPAPTVEDGYYWTTSNNGNAADMIVAKNRYLTLDGLRGVAALSVVLWHGPQWYSILRPSLAYSAVDLFFVLSGFVIAAAYEDRLRNGLTTKKFACLRAVRLYPLYILGTSVSVISLLASIISHRSVTDFHAPLWKALPFSIFLLPSPWFEGIKEVFPLNFPAWSLLCELVVNFVFAATFRLWTVKFLAAWCVFMGALIVIFPSIIDGGWSQDNFWQGFARVFYSFPMGVLIFRLRNYATGLYMPRPVVLIILFWGLIYMPVGLLSAALVLFGYPLLVACAARVEPTGVEAKVYHTAGLASYAIYSVHLPLMTLINAIVLKINIADDATALGVVFLLLIVVIGVLLEKFYDRAVRSYLTKHVLRPHIFAGLRNLRLPRVP
jgi:peptidoglycan/LPS O-acetylase OafA/YrhL